MNDIKYMPISCSFHDILLAKATLKERCEIKYLNNTNLLTIEAVIVDVFTLEKKEFLLTDNKIRIRLDRIVSVNDDVLSEFNSC